MESLLVFAKSPEAGKVKTRLAKNIGNQNALELYLAFLQDVIGLAQSWRTSSQPSDPNRRVVLCTTPSLQDPITNELARRCGARIKLQSDGDLGARLREAFDSEYERGARSVCVIGTDSPTLPRYLLDEAFRSLLFEDVTLGPTFDGGYWLIGAKRPGRHLFDDIEWSTERVMPQTLKGLKDNDLHASLLPFWYDVDESSDLDRLKWHVENLRQRNPNTCAHTVETLERLTLG